MISSRTHAAIDVGVALGLAATAIATSSPRSRVAAGTASCLLTAVSAATDYEGGCFPRLSLGAHRAIEAASGAALCAWSLRRGGSRALAAAGSVQLALALLSADRGAGPPCTVYAPLDAPKPFADGVWLVDSVLGPGLPVRMTVLRLANGDLVLHSPTRYSPALHRALERLGPIRHLVAPSSVHWVFMKAWQDASPEAASWAAPGLGARGQVRRSGLRIDGELGDAPPDVWRGEVELAVVRGLGGFAEVAMLHRASRTALLTDLVQNIEARKLPWVLRPVGRVLGNLAPDGRAPAHLRAIVSSRSRAAARRIVAWAPERVVVAHGRPIEHDAAAALARSLAWLAEG